MLLKNVHRNNSIIIIILLFGFCLNDLRKMETLQQSNDFEHSAHTNVHIHVHMYVHMLPFALPVATCNSIKYLGKAVKLNPFVNWINLAGRFCLQLSSYVQPIISIYKLKRQFAWYSLELLSVWSSDLLMPVFDNLAINTFRGNLRHCNGLSGSTELGSPLHLY